MTGEFYVMVEKKNVQLNKEIIEKLTPAIEETSANEGLMHYLDLDIELKQETRGSLDLADCLWKYSHLY